MGSFDLYNFIMETMETLIEVLSHLKDLGWDNEFKVNEKNRVELNKLTYDPDDIELIQTYRFEGETDPSEQAIVYVIKTSDGMIGYSIDSYGIYSNHNNDAYSNFISNLVQHVEQHN
jgi:hypothetical protein